MPKSYNATTNAIVDKIRMIRISKHYSQDYIAAKLNISQNAYSKIELGAIQITLDRLIKLAMLLEVDIADLFSKDGLEKTALKVVGMKSNSVG